MLHFGSITISPSKIELADDRLPYLSLVQDGKSIGEVRYDENKMQVGDVFDGRDNRERRDEQALSTLNHAIGRLSAMTDPKFRKIGRFLSFVGYSFTGSLNPQTWFSKNNTTVDYTVRSKMQSSGERHTPVVLFTPRFDRKEDDTLDAVFK
jgi:hypothetical protein